MLKPKPASPAAKVVIAEPKQKPTEKNKGFAITIPKQAEQKVVELLTDRDRAVSFAAPPQTSGVKITLGQNVIEATTPNESSIMMSDNMGPDASMQDDDLSKSKAESEYDPFAAEVMDDPEMQKCWLILGEIFYHYEATDFLEPITAERFGEDMFEEYCSIVGEPMDINTVVQKMRANTYMRLARGGKRPKELFRRDMLLIFDNCREFNEPDTEIVNSANSLTIEFKRLWVERGMW